MLYSPCMRDTSLAAERRYFELLRAQSPAERLHTAVRLTDAVRTMARAGIIARHPGATLAEINAYLAERLYGASTADRLFPDVKREPSGG